VKKPDLAKVLQRSLAYALAIVVGVEFISGYALLHPAVFGRMLSKPLAFRLHMAIQPVMAFFFLSHLLLSVRNRLRASASRAGKKTPLLDIAFSLAGIGLFSVSLYFAIKG
jgi:thiosulfate reductase cytochrome b subunit